MAGRDFAIDDVVWAKMKSYPWWPAQIAVAKKDVKKPVTKKPMHFVEFFGGRTYAWILDELIHPFEEYRLEHSSCSSASFKQALTAALHYIEEAAVKKEKNKDSTPKTSIVSQKKRILQLNHSPIVKPIKSSATKSFLKLQKQGSPGRATKKAPKRPIPETSNTSITPNKLPALSNKYYHLVSNLSPYLLNTSDSRDDDYIRQTPTSALLNRSVLVDKPTIEPIVFDESDQAMIASAEPSSVKIGFIGLGNMGSMICKKFVCAGYKVSTWNRTHEKNIPFKGLVEECTTPQDVVAASDITFCCVSDPNAAKEIVFGNCGVLKEIGPGKGFVEITSIDPETSKDIAEAILKKDGQYLESPVLGNRTLAESGQLIILAAGDNDFFEQCKPCFQLIGERAFFLGEVGNAAKMNLIINMMMGTSLVCLIEAMTLARSTQISQNNLLEIIELGPMCSRLFIEKAKDILDQKTTTVTPLEHLQKDLQLALQLGNQHAQSLPATAAANEVLKYAKGLGLTSHDITALYHSRRPNQ